MVLYEFLVRRFNLMRFLFGMKLHGKPIAVSSPELHVVNLPSISRE